MTLADQVRESVLAKKIVERGKAFEYYYYQLKIMVESDELMNTGKVVHYNRTKLNREKFNNANTDSRWYVSSYYHNDGRDRIELTLMR